nr:Gag-Pol polyprotein [Tanacetum cinerariifolium]
NQCKVTNHQVNVQFLLQLQQEWKSFVTLVKQSQELKNVSYHKLYDILKEHQHEVNEIRAEKIARGNSPWIHRNAGYEHQRLGNVVGARETVGEAGIQLNAEQADWKDDTDDESDDQELEAHYMYMAKLQQVSPDAVDSGPIFDKEPEQKLIEIVLFIVDSRCSKHMTGNLKLLINFVEKFL